MSGCEEYGSVSSTTGKAKAKAAVRDWYEKREKDVEAAGVNNRKRSREEVEISTVEGSGRKARKVASGSREEATSK